MYLNSIYFAYIHDMFIMLIIPIYDRYTSINVVWGGLCIIFYNDVLILIIFYLPIFAKIFCSDVNNYFYQTSNRKLMYVIFLEKNIYYQNV